jgi:hypothetical protein
MMGASPERNAEQIEKRSITANTTQNPDLARGSSHTLRNLAAQNGSRKRAKIKQKSAMHQPW